jgi:hypothetical protein
MTEREAYIRRTVAKQGRVYFDVEDVKHLLSIIDQLREPKPQAEPLLTPFYKEVDQ